MGVTSIVLDILAVDRASAVLRNIGNASGAGGTAVAAGIGLAGLAVAKFGVDSIKMGSEFDATIRQMGAVGGVPAPKLKELSDLALKMGADTKYSAGEAADAMLELAKGGMTAAQIKAGALKETLTLAAAGGVDLADAASTMSNALHSFGLDASQSGQVSAALAGAANASSASVESLAQGLAQVGPGAKNAGMSVQETTAALAAFANAGMQGSDAGTSFKTFLTTLVPKTTAAYNAFGRLGLVQFDAAKASQYLRENGVKPLGTSQDVLEGQIRKTIAAEKGLKVDSAAAHREVNKLAQAGITTSNAFFDATGKTKSLTEISGILKDKLGGLTEEEKNRTMAVLFGSDATRAATVLTNEGAEGMGKYTQATNDSGAANRVAAENMKGVKGALEQLQGSFETLQTRAGRALGPLVEKGALLGATMLGDVVPAVEKVGDVLGPVIDLAQNPAFQALALGVAAFALVLNAAAIASALGSVALSAYIAVASFGLGAFAAITGAAAAFNAVLLANPLVAVAALLVGLGVGLVYAYKHCETFRDVVKSVFSAVAGFVLRAIDLWLGAYQKLFQAMSHIPVIGGMFKGVADAIGGVRGQVQGLKDEINGIPAKKTVTISVVEQHVGKALADSYARQDAAAARRNPHPTKAPKTTAEDTRGPRTRRASGGPASGLVLLGEQGPELVDLPARSTVRSGSETRRSAGGVLIEKVEIIVQGARDARATALEIRRELVQLQDRGTDLGLGLGA